MAARSDRVIEALTQPASHFESWDAGHWTTLFQQSRSAALLGRVGARLRALWPPTGGNSPPWPPNLDGHLAAVGRLMRAQRAEVERELRHIAHALAELRAPVIVLKGAAYLAAGLPPGQARVFSDVDILVPKAAIAEAESRLMLHGWMGTHANAYDQRYYRQWMHELPPMQHVHRGTTLDLHHNILPETARLKPQSRHFVEGAVPLAGWPGLFVLAPADMVLHNVTHLFMNEEMSHALRDLSDLDLLLRHFSTQPGFWGQLLERAALLDLERPLHYGLRHVTRVLGTPLPPEVADRVASIGPPRALQAVMDTIWRRALRSPHPSSSLPGTAAALFALYVRGHWLRMPPWLLARHLTIKALRRRERLGADAPPAKSEVKAAL